MTNRVKTETPDPVRFNESGDLEIAAAAAGKCRRALWRQAAGAVKTDPPSDANRRLQAMNQALAPVLFREMHAAGWRVKKTEPKEPTRIGPTLLIPGQTAWIGTPAPDQPERIILPRIESPEGYRRWQTLGIERSRPAAATQLALQTLSQYGEPRDAVVAALDRSSGHWDYELIPARRIMELLQGTAERLSELALRHLSYGANPELAPPRDHAAPGAECNICPYRSECWPPAEPEPEQPEPVSAAAAQAALQQYEQASAAAKPWQEPRKQALAVLRAWLEQQGATRTELAGQEKSHTVMLVNRTQYQVDHKKLNELLDPATRAEIVTEQQTNYVRVN